MFIDGYSDTHITFQWETSSGMDFVPDTLQMHPQYILTNMELSQSFTAYVAGTSPDSLHRKVQNTSFGLIEPPLGVQEDMGSIPVGDSEFLFVPPSCNVD